MVSNTRQCGTAHGLIVISDTNCMRMQFSEGKVETSKGQGASQDSRDMTIYRCRLSTSRLTLP